MKDEYKSRSRNKNGILIFRPFTYRSFTRQMESQMAIVVTIDRAKTTRSNIY